MDNGGGIRRGLAMVAPVFAQNVSVNANVGGGYAGGHFGVGNMHGGPGPAMIPGVFGTVSTISGDTLTVTSKGRFGPGMATSTTPATPIVYTVDATNATVMKNGTSSTLSAIATGDTVMVQGTISGTNVTATKINDGVVPGAMMGRGGMRGGFGKNGTSTMWSASTTAGFQGNGEPVIGGAVAGISGTTLTVTNASNVTYTIDAASSTIIKNGTSTAFSNIAVGDNVIVQGTVNGTSVTASSVIDQGMSHTASSTPSQGGSHSGRRIPRFHR